MKILVVHDELDLPPGTARLKKGGGVAGHNGLKDISPGSVRISGVCASASAIPAIATKLPTTCCIRRAQEETELISNAVEQSLEVWPLIQAGEMEKAMHRLHTGP